MNFGKNEKKSSILWKSIEQSLRNFVDKERGKKSNSYPIFEPLQVLENGDTGVKQKQ